MRLFVDDYVQVRYTYLFNSKVRNDLKLLVIGDVHISDMVSLKKINLIKKQILNEKVDYIIFTGDLIDSVEALENNSSYSKLCELLDLAASITKTFVVLGNHDYIHRKNGDICLDDIRAAIRNVKDVILLDNDVYFDDNIYLMGYTQTREYYGRKNYNYDAFYNDFVKHRELYNDVNKNLPCVSVVHSPEFSMDEKCINLFMDYDLIVCGHTHDGCIPFGLGNFKRGIIGPNKKFFPKNVRGLRKLKHNYILITGGIVKIQECAPKLLHPFNHLCPMQMDVITLSKDKRYEMKRKWY